MLPSPPPTQVPLAHSTSHVLQSIWPKIYSDGGFNRIGWSLTRGRIIYLDCSCAAGRNTSKERATEQQLCTLPPSLPPSLPPPQLRAHRVVRQVVGVGDPLHEVLGLGHAAGANGGVVVAAVKGDKEPAVGVLGHDLRRALVVEMPPDGQFDDPSQMGPHSCPPATTGFSGFGIQDDDDDDDDDDGGGDDSGDDSGSGPAFV